MSELRQTERDELCKILAGLVYKMPTPYDNREQIIKEAEAAIRKWAVGRLAKQPTKEEMDNACWCSGKHHAQCGLALSAQHKALEDSKKRLEEKC